MTELYVFRGTAGNAEDEVDDGFEVSFGSVAFGLALGGPGHCR